MEPHIKRLLGKRKNKFDGADGYNWRGRECTLAIAWKGWFEFETEEDEDNVEPLINKRLERRRRERELKQMRDLNRNEESMAFPRKEKRNELDLGQTNTIVEILNTPEAIGISPSQTMSSLILIKEHDDDVEPLIATRIEQRRCESERKETRILIKNEENKTSLLGNDKENGAALGCTNAFVEMHNNLKSTGIASFETLSSSILNEEEKFMVDGIENLSYVTRDKKCVLLNVITERNSVKPGGNLINLNTEQINESNPKSNSFLILPTTPEVEAVPYDGACVQENSKKKIKNIEYYQCFRKQNSSSALRHDMSLDLLPKSSMIISKKFDVIEIDDTNEDENLDVLRDASKTSGNLGEGTKCMTKTLLWGGPLMDTLPYQYRPKEDESITSVDNDKDDIGDLNLSRKEKYSVKNNPNCFEMINGEPSNDFSRNSAKTWFRIRQPGAVLPFAVPVRKRQHRRAAFIKEEKKAAEHTRVDAGGINLSVEGKHPIELCLKKKVEFENDILQSSMKTRPQVNQPIPGFPSILPFVVPIRKKKERAEEFIRGISNDNTKCEGFHAYCPVCRNCFVGDINNTEFNMKFNEHIDVCMNASVNFI